MYLHTGEGLGYLSKTDPESKVQIILKAIRKDPKKWEGALLQTLLHPIPWIMDTPLWTRLLEYSLLEGEDINKIVNELKQIGKRHLSSEAFAKRYKKELKLSQEIDFRNVFDPKDLEKPYLLEASLLPKSDFLNPGEPWLHRNSILYQLAQRFSREKLPKDISDRVSKSLAYEAHYYRMGKFLYNMALKHQKENPVFKAKVEKAAKARQQKQGSKNP